MVILSSSAFFLIDEGLWEEQEQAGIETPTSKRMRRMDALSGLRRLLGHPPHGPVDGISIAPTYQRTMKDIQRPQRDHGLQGQGQARQR